MAPPRIVAYLVKRTAKHKSDGESKSVTNNSKGHLLHWYIVFIFCVGLVILAEYIIANLEYYRLVRTSRSQNSLGPLLTEDLKSKYANAYFDGEDAISKLDNVSWAPPNIPTPFVGNAPRPGKSYNATINKYQMRSERIPVMPKPEGHYRIFFTGGSAAYGAGALSQDRIIASYLERLLQERIGNSRTNPPKLRFEVFTAANAAWTTTHERIFIENRLSELDPDLVISFSGLNDVHWGGLGANILWQRTYYDELFYQLLRSVYDKITWTGLADAVKEAHDFPEPPTVAKRLLKNVVRLQPSEVTALL